MEHKNIGASRGGGVVAQTSTENIFSEEKLYSTETYKFMYVFQLYPFSFNNSFCFLSCKVYNVLNLEMHQKASGGWVLCLPVLCLYVSSLFFLFFLSAHSCAILCLCFLYFDHE